MSERDTCVTTRIFPRLNVRARSDGKDSSFNAGNNSGLEMRRAGARPKMIAARNESVRVKNSTRKSMAKSGVTGKAPAGGGVPFRAVVVHQASNNPTAPPNALSKRLS